MLDDELFASTLRAKMVRRKRVRRRSSLPSDLMPLPGQLTLKTPRLLVDMTRKANYARYMASYRAEIREDARRQEECERLKVKAVLLGAGVLL